MEPKLCSWFRWRVVFSWVASLSQRCVLIPLLCRFVLISASAAGLQVHPELPHPRRSQTHPDPPGPPGVRITGGSEEEGESLRASR